MGLFTFTSEFAANFWTRIDGLFPQGRWTDVKGKNAQQWSDAYDDLIKAADNFSGLKYDKAGLGEYKKADADVAAQGVKEKLGLWSNPGGLMPKDIANAIENSMKRLVAALPKLDIYSKNPGIAADLKKSVEIFMDTSFSLLKNVAGSIENTERRSSSDPDVKWQRFEDTMALLKLKDMADTIKKGIGGLPNELRMNKDDKQDDYFAYMARGFVGTDKTSPVPVGDLKESVGEFKPFTYFSAEKAEEQKALITAVGKASDMLGKLSSALTEKAGGGKQPKYDKQLTAQETLVYLESLTDLLEGKRGGEGEKAKIGLISPEEKQKFNEAASKSAKRIEEEKPERRWERREKKK